MKISTGQTLLITISSTIPSISAKSNSLRRALQANNCVPKSEISASVLENSLSKCISNDRCNTGLCRLFTVTDNQFLDCDEGNHFEGLWPALCADGDDSSESSKSSDSVDSTDTDTDNGDDTNSDNNVPVRSDCVETDSSDYESALENDASSCEISNDCSSGPCRLAFGSESKWLFCDEGNNFDSIGWLPVCNEQEVPIRQPDSGFCFPGTARVTVLDKGDITMSELQLGDSILVDTKGNYESVYTFGHYYPNSPKSPFIKIKTVEGSELTLSLNHMVKTTTSGSIPAVQIKKGDSLLNSSGKIEFVESTNEFQLQQGMYAPFTASGYLIVDNILVSNYVALKEESFLQIAGKSIISHQWIAHAFNAPHRMYCRYVTACTMERYNAEGISQFVATPFALSKWILNQNTIIMNVCSLIIAMLCGLFSIIEQYPIYVFLSLEAVAVLIFCKSLVKRVSIEKKQKDY